MSDFPGSAPPPDGVTPDLENPEDVLQTVMYITQGLTLLFVTVFVALRLYAKTAILGSAWSWDDCELLCLLTLIRNLDGVLTVDG
jgi:hypothetical protein